jgi:hypothetical protein
MLSCCPSGNVCSWSNAQVACCPSGCTCSGWEAVNGYSATSYYQQPTSTYYQPQSTYYQPTSTVIIGGGVVTQQAGPTTVYTQQQPTTQQYYGQYCSTLTQNGPHLPTTAAGECGTILIVAPSEAARYAMGWIRLGVVLVGMQAFGAMAFAWR